MMGTLLEEGQTLWYIPIVTAFRFWCRRIAVTSRPSYTTEQDLVSKTFSHEQYWQFIVAEAGGVFFMKTEKLLMFL